jgi:aminoglycoside phosphotransferase (APT) family kinase protein
MSHPADNSGASPVTTPVRSGHEFDATALGRHLQPHLPGFDQPFTIRQFEGGQSNPTFLIETAAGRYVLRKKPPGKLLPSAHQIEREYRVMTALGPTGVPVPHMRHFCEDPSVIGTVFYVMEHVAGRIFSDPLLPGLSVTERGAVFDAMNDTLARLHRVDWRAAGLDGFGRPDGYIARQVKRWTEQYQAARTDEIPAMEELSRWLVEHLPPDEPATIAHGDFRLQNLIFHQTEPRVLAVLDWELATIGHPLADLALNALIYRLPRDYVGLDAQAPEFALLGIPAEADYVAAYARRTGRDGIPGWPYFLAFSFFRMASILQGVYKRALDGNASSAQGLTVGARARRFAETGWRIARDG